MPDLETLDPTIATMEPGTLAPFNYSPKKMLLKKDLSEKAFNSLKGMVDRSAMRDMAARRWEVEQAWKQRLFDRGYQYLLRRTGGGWALPQDPVYGSKGGAYNSFLETDVYSANEQIIISALTRDIPKTKFEPQDPSNDSDITAADAAEEFKKVFSRNNDLIVIQTDEARYLWTDGRAHHFTRYVVNGQEFGYEDPEDAGGGVVPEDETAALQPDESHGLDGQEMAGGDEGEELAGATDQPSRGKPRGREVTDVFGKLEVKVPMNTKKQKDWHFLQFATEYDQSIAKAMFPWIANEIKPSTAPGENQLDRIARINCALALSSNYTTGDSMVNDVTVQQTWFRPSAFMDVQEADGRAELMQLFPDGALVVYAGQAFAFARSECMDDCWTASYATRGDGQNRASLGSRMVPLQERINNLVDLLYDFFVRTVPRRYMDSEAFNIPALKSLGQVVGLDVPFKRQAGVPFTELMGTDTPLNHQPELPEFIWKCINELSQLLSGAYPALSGGDTEGNDTASGISMQKAQAMGRLGVPWHSMQGAAAERARQAVQCAAVCRSARGETKIMQSVNNTMIEIELADLKGNLLCFPESDSNFPEDWTERQARYTQILQESKSNPLLMKWLSSGKNLRTLKDATGLELDLPDSDSYDKQMGELELLVKTGPIPNPKIAQAQDQLKQAAMGAASEGPQAMAQAGPMIQQATQMVAQLPPMISTVEIDEETDNHQVEAEACLEWINSPEGRKMRNGTPEEQAGFQNVRTHYLQHKALVPPPPPTGRPPAVSINYKDLQPDGQVQAAAEAGLKIAPPPPQLPAAPPTIQ